MTFNYPNLKIGQDFLWHEIILTQKPETSNVQIHV